MAQPEQTDPQDIDSELLEEITNRYIAARDHIREWRKEAKECFDYYACRQWSEEDRATLEQQMRPAITFNRAGILIDAVLGHENNNRNEIRYIPRTQGDAKVDEILTEVAKFFLTECDGEDEQSDAFRDMLISGMGWTNTRLDDETNPEMDLVVERVDPLEMLYDPSCKKPNLADARYFFREKRYDKDEVQAMFPDWDGTANPSEWTNIEDDDVDATHHPRYPYTNTNNRRGAPTRDILVLEYQYREIEPVTVVTDEASGKTIALSAKDYADVADAVATNGWQTKEQKQVVIHRAFCVGGEIVKQDQPCKKHFTYHCITGKRDRNKGTWFGLMRALKDPQQWSNKWLSQILNIVNRQAKGGLMVEEDAVDITILQQQHAIPGSIEVFKSGALARGAVVEKAMPQFPAAIDRLMTYANDSFGDVSGINAELLGMADRDQPGVLEYQRKQSAVSLLAPLFDSLRRYRKMFGRVWLYYIQTYVNDNRIVRITQDVGNGMEQQVAQSIASLNIGSAETAQYDVIVDQAASAPNQKEATWSVLVTLLPAIKDMLDPATMLTFLEWSPLPTSLVEELKQQQQQRSQQPPQPSPEEQKVQAQIQGQQAKMQIDQQTAQQQMQVNQQQSGQQLQIEQLKAQTQLEMKQKETELLMVLEQAKAKNEIEIARIKADAEMQVKTQMASHDAQLRAQSSATDNASKASEAKSKADSAANSDKMLKLFAESNSGMTDALAKLAATLSKPKKIIRDKSGRAAGVE